MKKLKIGPVLPFLFIIYGRMGGNGVANIIVTLESERPLSECWLSFSFAVATVLGSLVCIILTFCIHNVELEEEFKNKNKD